MLGKVMQLAQVVFFILAPQLGKVIVRIFLQLGMVVV
jgi:hypothetical protein